MYVFLFQIIVVYVWFKRILRTLLLLGFCVVLIVLMLLYYVFVAVVKYNYNQEDAMVANKSSMDMGLFGTSHYKRYADNELIDHETGE